MKYSITFQFESREEMIAFSEKIGAYPPPEPSKNGSPKRGKKTKAKTEPKIEPLRSDEPSEPEPEPDPEPDPPEVRAISSQEYRERVSAVCDDPAKGRKYVAAAFELLGIKSVSGTPEDRYSEVLEKLGG